VGDSDSDSAGGRVDATRALKPREKEGGRMENSCVWKVSVYADEIVAPSLWILLIRGIIEESWKRSYSGGGDHA
jgi:hypothetical protein